MAIPEIRERHKRVQKEKTPLPRREVSFPPEKERLLADLLNEYLELQAQQSRSVRGLRNATRRLQVDKIEELAKPVSQEKKTLTELKNKTYSFSNDKVAAMFQVLTRSGLKLPECKRPLEANMTNEPNYCPYHRILGHKIEDCWVLKDLLEKKRDEGSLTLASEAYLDGKRATPSIDKGKEKMIPRALLIKEASSKFEEGDLVLMSCRPVSTQSIDGKSVPKWEGGTVHSQTIAGKKCLPACRLLWRKVHASY
jgi:hypothetical protein